MGLLDDAIREHLELKRRHGADQSEIARQEQEALGPARRGPEPLEVPQRDPAAEAADPALLDPQVDAPLYDEPAEPADEDDPDDLVAVDDAAVAEPEVDEPLEPERPEAAAPEPDEEQPTVAFDAADVEEAQRRVREPEPEPERRHREPEAEPERRHREPDAEAGEDVLEETPDFLQETPEHDRLWFEQRPPRDFDFDD